MRDGDCPACAPAKALSPTATAMLSGEPALVASAAAMDAVIANASRSAGHDIIRMDSPAHGLHTSVFYFCCHSAGEVATMVGALRSMRWTSFVVDNDAFGCNVDHDNQTVYLHAMPSNQTELFALAGKIEAALRAAGVPVNHPRRSLFHMTLARVTPEYPTDDVVRAHKNTRFGSHRLCSFGFAGVDIVASDCHGENPATGASSARSVVAPPMPPPPAAPATATVWQPWEVALTSSVSYPQPKTWWGVELNATFTHAATGASLLTPGFWDGNTTWRVRFSPPTAGDWTYVTSCSDAGNRGLQGVTGSFSAAAYDGANTLFAHGVLRPSASGRFFEHADGTPFYWLGDTHWSGFSTAEHWAGTDNSTVDPGGPASMLKEMVDVRARQGYSVWKGETFVVNGAQGGDAGGIANAGGFAWGEGGMYGELRPEFWRAIDDIVAYINSKGIVVSFAFAGIGRGLTKAEQEAPIAALARYCVGRYAAYHTVWTTCQEYCAGTDFPDAWARIGALQWELDPHKRSTSLHNCFHNPIPKWRSEPWYGHVTLQQGHFMTSPVTHWLTQYSAAPPRVLVEDEANYERLKYASMTSNVPGWLTRQSAWQSQVGGATGYTYGGQGIWWACYNRTYVNGNCGPNDPPGPTPPNSGFYTWDQCLDFPVGGHQLPAMAAFWRRLPWHTLEPNGTAVEWAASAPGGTQQPYQKADAMGDHVVAYLPQRDGNPHSWPGPGPSPPGDCRPRENNATAFGGTVRGVNPRQPHRVAWFNPRTGAYSAVATVSAGATEFAIPATRPSDPELDWVLLVEPSSSTPPPGLPRFPPPLPGAHGKGAGAVGHGGGGVNAAVPLMSTAAAAADAAAAAAAARPPTPLGTSWVRSVQLHGRVRTEPGDVGCTFNATQPMRVTHVCRLPAPGSRNVQRVSVFTKAGSRVASAAVDVLNATTKDANGFVCAPIDGGGQAALSPGGAYVLTLSTVGCDGWYDDTGTEVSVVGGDAAAVLSVYGTPPALHPGGGGAGHCYGPVNFYFE